MPGFAAALVAISPVAAHADAGFDDDVLAEINWVRAHPRQYADELRDYRARFQGLVTYPEEAPDGVMTNEGVAAVDDAIAFLDRQAPMPPLGQSGMLALGAGELVADQGSSGRIGHYTGGGLDPGARMRLHGGGAAVGEVIAYGPQSPRAVVRQLIVDDGVARRGHRTLLFLGMYRYAGARCGPHREWGAMCVIDLSATANGGAQPPRGSDAGPGAPPAIAGR